MFHVASAGMGGGSALCRPLQNPVWHGASEMLTSLASLNLLLSGVEDPANVWGWEAECRSIPIYSSCSVLSLLRAQVPLMPASPGSSSMQIDHPQGYPGWLCLYLSDLVLYFLQIWKSVPRMASGNVFITQFLSVGHNCSSSC